MGGPFEDLERWVAEAKARDAADARVRERWLRTQAGEEATLDDLLSDLVERGARVVLTTVAGRRHVGRIAAVGSDFVAIGVADGPTTLVALRAVATLTTGAAGVGGGEPPALQSRGSGDGHRRRDAVSLVDLLAQACGHRPRVQVRSGAASVVGELRAMGHDVITVRTDGEPPALAYARLASVSEISLLDSG